MLLIQAHRAEEKNIEISEALAAQANVRFKADDNARLKDQVLDSYMGMFSNVFRRSIVYKDSSIRPKTVKRSSGRSLRGCSFT